MKWLICTAWIICGLALSCTDIRYTKGRWLLAEKQYEDASYFAEDLVKESPDDPTYRELLNDCRKSAAEYYFEKAKSFQESDIQTARHYFARAKKMDPDNEAIVKIENTIDARKTEIREAIDKAEASMNEGNWDDAILQLSKLQQYRRSYQDLETALDVAVRESFDSHFLQGIRSFEAKDYRKACEEFQTCLQRKSDDALAGNWLEISVAHQQVRETLDQGRTLFDKSEYQAAFETITRAKNILSGIDELYREIGLWLEAQRGLDSARRKWTEELYARGLFQEGRQTKAGYLGALERYRDCLGKIENFRDCAERTKKINRELATILQREGRMLLGFPRLQYAALAHRFFVEAYRYDGTVDGLSADLFRSRELSEARLETTIKVRVKGNYGYCADLEQDLVEFLHKGHYPYVSASRGDTSGIFETCLQRLVSHQYLKGGEKPDIRFNICQLQLEVLRSVAQKTGDLSSLDKASAYHSHLQRIQSIEYLGHMADLEYREKEHPALWAMASSLRNQTESRRQVFLSAQNNMDRQKELLDQANAELGRVSAHRDSLVSRRQEIEAKVAQNKSRIQALDRQIEDSRIKAQHASTPEQKKYYEEMAERLGAEKKQLSHYNDYEAPPLLSSLAADIGRAQNDVTRAQETGQKQQRLYDEAREETQRTQAQYHAASGQLSRAEGELSACNYELGRLQHKPESTEAVPVKSAYAFRCYPFQVFGTVWVKGYLLHTTDHSRIEALEVKKEKHLEDATLTGVEKEDVFKVSSRTENLVSAKDLELELQDRATSELKLKLDTILRKRHQRYWDLALEAVRENHTLESGENLSLFIQCVENAREQHEKYGEAVSRLQKIVNTPIE